MKNFPRVVAWIKGSWIKGSDPLIHAPVCFLSPASLTTAAALLIITFACAYKQGRRKEVRSKAIPVDFLCCNKFSTVKTLTKNKIRYSSPVAMSLCRYVAVVAVEKRVFRKFIIYILSHFCPYQHRRLQRHSDTATTFRMRTLWFQPTPSFTRVNQGVWPRDSGSFQPTQSW